MARRIAYVAASEENQTVAGLRKIFENELRRLLPGEDLNIISFYPTEEEEHDHQPSHLAAARPHDDPYINLEAQLTEVEDKKPEEGGGPFDVIVVMHTQAIKHVRNHHAKQTGNGKERTPTVLAVSFHPHKHGAADTLKKPGRRITGVAIPTAEIVKERMVRLKAVTGAAKVAVLHARWPANFDDVEWDDVKREAPAAGMNVEELKVDTLDEIRAELARIRPTTDALYVMHHPLLAYNRTEVAKAGLAQKFKGIFPFRDYVEAGGLMSYGADRPDVIRRAASYVARVLGGEEASDMEMKGDFDLYFVVNTDTAGTLGVDITKSPLDKAERFPRP